MAWEDVFTQGQTALTGSTNPNAPTFVWDVPTPVDWEQVRPGVEQEWADWEEWRKAHEAWQQRQAQQPPLNFWQQLFPWLRPKGEPEPQKPGREPLWRENYPTEEAFQQAAVNQYMDDAFMKWLERSGFEPDTWDPRVRKLAIAMGRDWTKGIEVQEEQARTAWDLAKAFQEEYSGKVAQGREDLKAAFGGDLSATLGDIEGSVAKSVGMANWAYGDVKQIAQGVYNQTMQSAREGYNAALQAAHVNYQDVVDRFDRLASMQQVAIADSKSAEAQAIKEHRDMTFAAVEQFRTQIIQGTDQQIKEALTQLQALGYGPDTPQAQEAITKIKMGAVGQVGTIASQAKRDYFNTQATMRTNFAQQRAGLESSFAAAHATGLGALAEAGRVFTGLFSEAGRILADTAAAAGRTFTEAMVAAGNTLSTTVNDAYKWGESEKSSARSLWTNSNLELTKLGLLGDQMTFEAASAANEKNKWTPESTFMQALIGLEFSMKQTDIQNFYEAWSLLISTLTVGFTAAGVGGFGKPSGGGSESGFGFSGGLNLGPFSIGGST